LSDLRKPNRKRRYLWGVWMEPSNSDVLTACRECPATYKTLPAAKAHAKATGHTLRLLRGLGYNMLAPVPECTDGDYTVNLAAPGGNALQYCCSNCGTTQRFPHRPRFTRCSQCLKRGGLKRC